jgi:hypothetical protein
MQWEGSTVSLRDIVREIILHDVQHAAQIEYLRELHRTG